jgi:hypothetical protein
MAARNESKAVAAISQLESEGLGDGSVHFLSCNLPDPHAVKKAAQGFLKLETRLDILGAPSRLSTSFNEPCKLHSQQCGYVSGITEYLRDNSHVCK